MAAIDDQMLDVPLQVRHGVEAVLYGGTAPFLAAHDLPVVKQPIGVERACLVKPTLVQAVDVWR